jgi:tRNA A37 threonylcarbamoyladenosine dehydratase
MKKLAILFTVLIAAAAIFVSCGGAETPSSITKEVYNKMASGDYDYVIDKIDTKGEEISSEDREKLKKMFEMSAGQLKEKGGIKNITIKEEKMAEDGNSCTVTAEVEYGNGETEPATSNFVKVNGEWKISVGQ